jgi:hypothetical protein
MDNPRVGRMTPSLRFWLAVMFVAAGVLGVTRTEGAPAVAGGDGERAAPTEAKRLTLDPYGITIDYRASDERVARMVASIFEERTPGLAREIGLDDVRAFHVVLVPDIKEYEERTGHTLVPWGVAFAFPNNGIVLVDVKRATNAWNSLEKVIPHETSHMLLGQRLPGIGMPLWFVEGLAQWQARQWSVLDNWRLMESVWGNSAPRLEQLVSAFPMGEERAREAYRVAYTAFQHRFDKRMDRLPGFLDEVARRGDFSEAFGAWWGEEEGAYYARFAKHLESKYKTGLMLFQTGPLFTLLSVLFVLVVVGRWVRNRRKLRRMEADERGWTDPGGYQP